MELAVETPAHLIPTFGQITDFDFVIGSYCKEHPEYLEGYKQHRWSNSQRKLILDNGAFENGHSMDPHVFMGLARELNATILVLPDSLGDSDTTLANAQKWFHKFKDVGQVMGVLQGRTMDDYDLCLDVYARMGVDYIGIPYHSIDRGLWMSQRQKDLASLRIHILGLRNPFEVLDFRQYPFVVSLDTSLPVGSALQYLAFRSGQFGSKRFNPSEKIVDGKLELARDNIRFLAQICHGQRITLNPLSN